MLSPFERPLFTGLEGLEDHTRLHWQIYNSSLGERLYKGTRLLVVKDMSKLITLHASMLRVKINWNHFYLLFTLPDYITSNNIFQLIPMVTVKKFNLQIQSINQSINQ